MEERREYYRFTLPAGGLVPVTFRSVDGKESFSAQIVNLSVRGFCVGADVPAEVAERAALATFTLTSDPVPLTIPVKMVYSRGDKQRQIGFCFMFNEQGTQREAQGRQIFRFIIKEQSRQRREARRGRRSSARINVARLRMDSRLKDLGS